jgi:hypothetical protein
VEGHEDCDTDGQALVVTFGQLIGYAGLAIVIVVGVLSALAFLGQLLGLLPGCRNNG